jgi:hypothetical protein
MLIFFDYIGNKLMIGKSFIDDRVVPKINNIVNIQIINKNILKMDYRIKTLTNKT